MKIVVCLDTHSPIKDLQTVLARTGEFVKDHEQIFGEKRIVEFAFGLVGQYHFGSVTIMDRELPA